MTNLRRAQGWALGAVAIVLVSSMGGLGCERDWDAFDPRLGSSSASGVGAAGAGGMAEGSVVTTGTGGDSSSSSAGGGGEGAGGGGRVSPPCGGIAAFADDFDDGKLHALWQPQMSAGSVDELNGQVRITIPPMGQHAQIGTTYRYDLRQRGATLQLGQPPAGEASLDIFFALMASDNSGLEFGISNGELYSNYYLDNQYHGLGSTPFDHAQHRWWRIRTDASTIYWEVSADGMDWGIPLSQVSLSLLPSLEHVRAVAGATRLSSANTDGVVYLDSYNLLEPSEPLCKARTLVDDFSVDTIPPVWVVGSPHHASLPRSLGCSPSTSRPTAATIAVMDQPTAMI